MMIGKLLKNKAGQSMVEMAIILPVLLLVLMGIFEFGRIFNSYLILTNASREAARSAAIGSSDTEITQTINGSIFYLDTSDLTISISPSEGSRSSGTNATVNLKYEIDIVTPIIDGLIPDPLIIESETVMRVE